MGNHESLRAGVALLIYTPSTIRAKELDSSVNADSVLDPLDCSRWLCWGCEPHQGAPGVLNTLLWSDV